MTEERANAEAASDATVVRGAGLSEQVQAHGRFEIVCTDSHGWLKWREVIDNMVVIVGKNLMLDTMFAGGGYTTTGPFLGLISSVSYSAIAASDTMLAHPGWKEAGGINAPTYTGDRKTMVWSPASSGSKALSASLSYAITGAGTVKGAFVCFGSGASPTKDDTGGVLWSAGLFTGGDKTVANTDTINVNYSTSL